jgi:hypothetical protein
MKVGSQGSLQEMLFESDLEFGIQRNRTKRGIFIDVSITLHFAVVAARGREHEALDSGVLITKPEQRRGRFQVDGAGEVRLLGARGIANDCRQMGDRFDAVERGGQCLVIAHVGADEFEARMRHDIQQGITTEEQSVHAPNMVALVPSN